MSDNFSNNLRRAPIALQREDVLSYFYDSPNEASSADIVMSLDRFDVWAVDFDEENCPQGVELVRFLKKLESLFAQYADVLHLFPGEMARLLTRLVTSRCSVVLTELCKLNPEFAMVFFSSLQGNDGSPEIPVLQKRLKVVARVKKICGVFAEQRLVEIVRIHGSYSR